MKKVVYTILVSMFISCSPTLLKSTWKSNEYVGYKAENVLIVGVTQNTTARMKYEERLKNEFNKRGVKSSQSALIFEDSFKNSKQTEENIEKEVAKLVNQGYETVLISAVTGVDEKVQYSGDIPTTFIGVHRFGRRYYLYQDIYFRPGYYDSYKVYHIETSIYNLKTNNEKSLVWVGSYDLVDPSDINYSVNKYVKTLVNSLEEEKIITKIGN
ncbi:hypothetical protein C7447_101884 [Tenacibaculum adriaticum]|uniref:Lipoprotein n=1 Tax=Tenacibaculum adriaticum TaxID=413713 RepID=A0A5S5DWH3_9FLAO|nr:hypothetical protein [Tenacibaculum adriaticum]TYQ00274.1 hypothetical protein C7447_101884 [Tenacibaculum adriaticum]